MKVEKCKKMSNAKDKEMQDMYCKNCGKEIKEGNTFCTNCGKPIENNKQENIKTNSTEPILNQKKKGFKIRVWHILLLIIFIIIIVISVILLNKKNNDSNSTYTIDNVDISEEDYKYITQVSNVSPTNREFVGVLSDNITEMFKTQYKQSSIAQFKYYNTSVNNMKVYSIEGHIDNRQTGNKDSGIEDQYYYNAINNSIIGNRFYIIDISYFTNFLNTQNMTLDEFESTCTNANIVIFRNFFNDQSETKDEKASQYIEYWTNQMNENGIVKGKIDIQGEEYNYQVIGDVLKIVRLFNNNVYKSMELIYLAYDINSSPEETIKNWVNSVSLQDVETTNNTTGDFIVEIKSKYPTESEMICTNGEEYWILNEDGKKIYFDSLDSFEKAIAITGNNSVKETETTDESIKDTSNSNENNKTNNNNKNNNNSNNAKEIWIYENDISNLSEESLYNFLTNNNLKYNVTTKTENVTYLDKKAGNSYFKLARYGEYQSGSTVEIIKTTYVGTSWNAKLSFTDLADISINYNGGNCTFSKYAQEDYAGFLENPEGKDIYYVPMGMQFYINGDLLKKNDNYYKYTFNNSKTATLKIVVPYLYSYNEQKVINQNVTIYQKTINLEELYNSGGEVKQIELPTR